jgi:Fe-S cluster assembly ATP-binding protein
MKGLRLDKLVVETREGKRLLDGVSMEFRDGTNYALLGPNGAGKSSLVAAVMGHPGYVIKSGAIMLDGEDITALTADEKARRGLFLAMQYPVEIAGVSYASFLRTALARRTGNRFNFIEVLTQLGEEARGLGFREFDPERELNVGFSGGEKKKSEILQMLMLRPRFAFLDEPDSGLDKKSVALLAARLQRLDYPTSLILITHHDQVLEAVAPEQTYDLGAAGATHGTGAR